MTTFPLPPSQASVPSPPHRCTTTQANPAAPRAPPMLTTPVGAFTITGTPLEIALTNEQLRLRWVTIASTHRRPPQTKVSKNGFPLFPRSCSIKCRSIWCPIAHSRALSGELHVPDRGAAVVSPSITAPPYRIKPPQFDLLKAV
jgi:hypothetical protein